MSKSIDTLVSDIYRVFTKDHKVSEENLNEFGESVKNAIRVSIKKASESREATLRFSVIGKPDRQLWFELKQGLVEAEENPKNPEKFIKFLYGDLIEQLLVFLIKEAGHTITHQQEEVELNGVLGHTDGAVDNVVVDFKSASNYQFNTKFKTRKILSDPSGDPFGYRGQLSGYHQTLLEKYPDEIVDDSAAWIVFNKETGEILLIKVDTMELINAEDRVNHLREVLSKDTPPETKCFPETVHDNGNRELHKSCTYCAFKGDCWKTLRAFKYSTGIKYFSDIVKLPKVDEVTDEIF